jgi:hypothetical protein
MLWMLTTPALSGFEALLRFLAVESSTWNAENLVGDFQCADAAAIENRALAADQGIQYL